MRPVIPNKYNARYTLNRWSTLKINCAVKLINHFILSLFYGLLVLVSCSAADVTSHFKSRLTHLPFNSLKHKLGSLQLKPTRLWCCIDVRQGHSSVFTAHIV